MRTDFDSDIIQREHNSILQTYKRLPIAVDRAEGCYIYDKNGNVYLDFLAGIAVNMLGHSHPAIIEAVTNQLNRYMHLSNYFYQEAQVLLAEKLVEMTGYDKVFFANSGTEAIEGAVKLIRRGGNIVGKDTIISFTGGFHGRSYAALSMMDKPNYKEGMEPFLSGTTILHYNSISELKEYVNDRTAAVVLEFIQGEGGIVEANKDFVDEIMRLRAKHSFYILADEIQAGIGRTGKFFSFEHYDVKPDIIVTAKALGGGLPLGAIITLEHLSDIFQKGMHGTTFGGNALACAAGLASLKILESGLLEKVINTGDYLNARLNFLKSMFPEIIYEVRGRGLMAGLKLKFNASILVDKLLELKIISNACSENVLRILPPLIIGEREIDYFVNSIESVLKKI